MIIPLFLEQLLSFSMIVSVLTAVLVLIGNEGMLRMLFGKVEDSVMEACINAAAYPFSGALSNELRAAGDVMGKEN